MTAMAVSPKSNALSNLNGTALISRLFYKEDSAEPEESGAEGMRCILQNHDISNAVRTAQRIQFDEDVLTRSNWEELMFSRSTEY